MAVTERIFRPTAQSLASIKVFRELGPKDRGVVAARCQGLQVPAQHEIISHTDTSRDVHFLVSGRVRATICSLHGREVAFRDLGPGVAFGDLSAIDGRPRCATVKALEECAVTSMSAESFWDVMMEYPRIAGEVLKELASLVRYLSERIVEISTLDVKHRIYAELLRLAEEAIEAGAQGLEVELLKPPTHEALANRINTHREAVTKELNRLAKAAVIAKRPGSLVVRDIDRLKFMVRKATGS